MKISYKADYALKAILNLAVNYEAKLLTSNQLATRIDAPIKFMEQVLLELKKGGFIESRRGKIGGYTLSKSPKTITVGDVLRHIDGAIEPIACINDQYSNCKDIDKCVFKKIWTKVHIETTNIVDNVTFEDLADEIKAKDKVSFYSI